MAACPLEGLVRWQKDIYAYPRYLIAAASFVSSSTDSWILVISPVSCFRLKVVNLLIASTH